MTVKQVQIMKGYISDLIKERKSYAVSFGIDESRSVYNPLIRFHIKGVRENKTTVNPEHLDSLGFFED